MTGHTFGLGSPKCSHLSKPSIAQVKQIGVSTTPFKPKSAELSVPIDHSKRNEVIDKVLNSKMIKFRAWCVATGRKFRLNRRLVRKYLKS